MQPIERHPEHSPEFAKGTEHVSNGNKNRRTFSRDNKLAYLGLVVVANLVAAGLVMLFPAASRPYYFFIGANALVTWYGGWKPGIISGVVSAGLAAFLVYLPSRASSPGMIGMGQYWGFLGVLGLVVALSGALRHKDLELEEMYLHFAGVVQISEDAIITVNKDQNITLFNVGAEMIFGYSSAEVMGKSINILLPDQFRKMHEAHLKAFAKSPDVLRPMSRRGSLFGLRKNGVQFPAEASISKFDAAGERIMTVRLRDITDRVAAEHRLNQLAALVESSKDAIVGEDMDGIIRSWNRGAEALYGYSSAEVLGKSATTLLPTGTANEIAANLDRAREGVSTNYDTIRMRKDGSLVHVALTVSPIYDKQEVVGVSSIARDITERLRLEQLLNRSQKMEAVGLLAGGVAHDFNNLLAVIVGHAYIVHSSGEAGEQIRKAGEEIINASEKAGALTRQLLAFGRKQITNPRVLDLNEITAGLGKMIPRLLGEDVDVRVLQGAHLKALRADPSQIEQVIMNLVVNARDAMPNGGKLTIETSNVYFGEAEARSHNLTVGNYVLLAVSDTGEGMSEETRAHIFEPFFTTKEQGKGTGLGLSTVYGIVSQNHGHVWVYSELGHGTTFKIYFPATLETAITEPLTAHRHELTVCGTETVLLVEDQGPLRELFTHVLRDKGYKVISASGGLDALEQTSEWTGPVHLLLTDVIMPNMRGDQVAEALTARFPNIRVIFMSGHTDSALLHNGSLPDNVVFLQKPFTPDVMLRLIRKVLDDAVSGEEENDMRGAM